MPISNLRTGLSGRRAALSYGPTRPTAQPGIRRCLLPVGSSGACLLLLFHSASHALAQDALRSALSVQSATAQPETITEPPPDQTRLGPIYPSLTGTIAGEYDDNIDLNSVNAKADYILNLGLSANFTWPATEQSEIRLNSGFSYAKYLTYSGFDHTQVLPGTLLDWSVRFNEGTLTFFDQFNYSPPAISEGALAQTGVFGAYDNTVGTRVTWLPRQWQWDASYSHNNYIGEGSLNYLNRASEFFYTAGAWRFAENTRAGVEGTVGITAYDQAVLNNNTSYSFGPYAEWQITQDISLSLHGGPTIYQFDHTASGPPVGTLNSYYINSRLNQQLTGFLGHFLQVNHSVQLGLNQGSDYIESWLVNYGISWQLRDALALASTFNYEDGTQPLLIGFVPVKENYQRYGGSLTLSWQATQEMSASVGYTHWSRLSNFSLNAYEVNTVILSLNYKFF